MTEVAGVEELGLIGRGEDAEITTYLERGILSELSANAIDLCPVGALTHRPWAFNARPWELRDVETIDVMDAVGSAISIGVRGRDVMRILPRTNDAVNEEWISDKTRHVADGLRTQRLDQPYVRKDAKLQPVSWEEALAAVAAKLRAAKPERIGAIAGDLAGAEEMFALKDLFGRLGSTNLDCRQDGSRLDPRHGRGSYVFNATINGIEQADAILIVGANPRLDAAVLNARILKRYKQTGLPIGVIGERASLTYPYEYLGAGTETLAELTQGSSAFTRVLKAAKNPLVIVGAGVYTRPDGAAVLAAIAGFAITLAPPAIGNSPFNVLQTVASRVAGLDLGFVPGSGGLDVAGMVSAARTNRLDVLYLLGADELDLSNLSASTFVIYQGSHGDAGAHRADVILPGAAYSEKAVTYANTEGRVQMTVAAATPPGMAKEDWAILRALSAVTGHTLPYDDIATLRTAMYKAAPVLAQLGRPTAAPAWSPKVSDVGKPASSPFVNPIRDYYLTNPIARASSVMAEMSALKAAAVTGATRDGSVGSAAAAE